MAIVMLLAATTMVMASSYDTREKAPQVAFDTEPGTNLVIEHDSGDTVDTSKLRFDGATLDSAPAELATGDTMTVTPASGVEELTLIWDNGRTSYILWTFDLSSLGDSTSDASDSSTDDSTSDSTDDSTTVSPPSEPDDPTVDEPLNCIEIRNDRTTPINVDGRCVIVFPDVRMTGNFNGQATEYYIREGASIDEQIRPSGDIVVNESAVVDTNIDDGDDVYVGPDARVTGTLGVTGDVLVDTNASVGVNVNGADDLLLERNASVVGNVGVTGNVSLGTNATVGESVNDGHHLFLDENASVGSDAQVDGAIVVAANATVGSSTVTSDVNEADELYLESRSTVVGDVNIAGTIYLADRSQITGTVNGGTLAYVYD